MSTLTTRIAGYKFEIITSADGRKFGQFEAEKDGRRVTFMDLPFELRSAYEQENGQTLPIMLAAYESYLTLRERVEWTADSHGYFYRGESVACTCEQCQIADAMHNRVNIARRGNQSAMTDRQRRDAYGD